MSFIGIVRPICSLLKPFWRPCDDDHGALRGTVMAPTGLASCATHRRQHCFGMGQPERHVHCAAEVNSGRQRRAGLLRLAGLGVQGAEAMVAVGLERPAYRKYLIPPDFVVGGMRAEKPWRGFP